MPPGSPEPPRREDAPTLSQPPRPEPSDGTLSLPAAPADGTLSLPAQPHDGTLSLPARQDDGTLSQPEPLHAEAPGAAPDWKVGDVIEGRYEVLGLIGRGGMGAVYKVRHLAWSLELAVKTPLPNLVANPAARARFLREAQTWVDLGLHPNIVQCWYVRELGGLPRVFVDFMPSGDLKDLRRSGQIQAGDWPRIVDLAVQAADGLGYAHQKGVVHRDVKPGNMLIAADGRVCVTDFGLVKLANAEDIQGAGGAPAGGDPALTMAGATMGTPQYGAPEQWGRAQSVDARADVYALGIVLYELLAGRRPFDDGVNAEPAHVLIARHLTSAPPDPREFNAAIPEPLASFALRCLAKQPDRRPPEMRAFREELAALYAPLAGRPYPRELPSAAEARADAFNNRAVSFFDLGRPKEAFAAWDEALRLDGRHPEALYNRSILEWRAARVTDLEVEERLRESAQAYPRARLYLGYLNLERFAAEPAEKAIAEALQDEILAQDGGAWRALGHARAAQGRFAEASEAYAQALQRMPGDAGAREGEAWALAQASPLPWRRCAQVLSDLGSSVLALAPLPDGRSILAACGDYAVRQLELPGGRQMLAYTGHAKEVFALAVLPGGRQFVTAGGDSNLKLWNLGRETSLDSFYGKAHAGHVFGLAAAPDGSFLVSAGRDKGVRLWKLPAGDVAKTLRGHEEAVLALALSPDGRLALSADEHGALRLWDTAAGAEAGGFGGNAKPAQTVGFSPDGAHAASGGEDGSLCLWDVAARKLARTFRGHRGTVRAAAFSPDGRRLVSGGDDRTVRVWDTASGRCLATFREHAGPLRALALGADGASVFSGAMESAGQPLRRWDLALGLPPVQEAEAFARLAAPLVVCRVESQVQAQAASRRFREQLAVAEQALKADDPSRAFHSLRRARTVAGYEHDPQALELNSKLARRLPCTGLNSAYRRFQLEAHPRGLAGLALAPDARLAVTCGREEKSVTLWDLAAQRAAWTFEAATRGRSTPSRSPSTASAWSRPATTTCSRSGNWPNGARAWRPSRGTPTPSTRWP
ncbi:MAG: protein kinase [Planctomycetota bacterium]|nr:protein kinase [Planctomycetota bacterium]